MYGNQHQYKDRIDSNPHGEFQGWKSPINLRILEDEGKKAVLRAILDDQSRIILTSTMAVGKSVIDITREQQIPVTSAYRKAKELKEFGLLKVERIVITEDGKKYEVLRSAVRAASVQFDKATLDVDVTANLEADEKMVKRFFTLKGAT